MSRANTLSGVEFRHLRMIVEVVASGSLTAAAKQLFLSQSALSHQLKLLERAVGCELFSRQGKKMVLTPTGVRLHRSAESILSELDNTSLDLQRLVTGESGTIRLSTVCSTCYSWLPGVMVDFQKKYPNVDIEPSVMDDVDAAIVRGEIDLGILNMPKRDFTKLHQKPPMGLFEDDLVVVVSKDHPLANAKNATPKRLQGQNLVLYKGAEARIKELLFSGSDYTSGSITSFQLTEAIFEWVAAGLGIGVMSRWNARKHIDSGRVVGLRIPSPLASRVWYAKFSSDKPYEYMAYFVGLMRKRCPAGTIMVG